ncbi:MAG: hypothetical protein GXO87_05935 [Chlorobi bacterium]|nr:hypothetical protein [Chlorobiota bacterium]
MKKLNLFLLSFLFVTVLNAQSDLRVEKFDIDGTLTVNDPISENLGRINAVQFNFNEGDRFYSELTADFFPMLVLVAPSGEYNISYPKEGERAAIFDDTIKESGQWLLYIVGDSTDTGNYHLTNMYASAKSLELNDSLSFCDKLQLLILHDKANFYFLRKNPTDEEAQSWESKITFADSGKGMIFGSDLSTFKALLFKTDVKELAEEKMDGFSDKIENCLSSDWEKIEGKWQNVLGTENIKEKKIAFVERGKENRYIKLTETEITTDTFPNIQYRINIIVSREEMK